MLRIKKYMYYNIFKSQSYNPLLFCTRWVMYLLMYKAWNTGYILKNFILHRARCDILLINPSRHDNSARNIPIGLACIASCVQKHGFKVKVLDLWGTFGKQILWLILRLLSPKIVGISTAITRQAPDAYSIGKLAKKCLPKSKVVYGGLHATYFPEEPFREGCADYVILGEGEMPFVQLAILLMEGCGNIKDIKGLAYSKGERVVKNGWGEPIDLNKSPFPAYHLLNMKNYDTDLHIMPYAIEQAADIITSRGCPNNCAYCGSPFLYRRNVRFKSPKLMIKEVEHIKQNYGITHFHFHDDDFLLDLERVNKFCSLLISSNAGIKWLCLTNANTLLKNMRILKKMKESGCVTLEFGIETVDSKVLKMINKAQQTSWLLNLSAELKKVGIIPQYLVMSFNPGETIESARKTAELVYLLNYKQNPNVVPYLIPHHHNFALGFFTTPYPGCRLYGSAAKEGIVLAKEWKDYHPERVNFIPYSFLNDAPEKSASLTMEAFTEEIRKYKGLIQAHRMNGYRIYPWLKSFRSYSLFLYHLFGLCDRGRTVREVHEASLNLYPHGNIGYTCAGIRLLAMFRLIQQPIKNSDAAQ